MRRGTQPLFPPPSRARARRRSGPGRPAGVALLLTLLFAASAMAQSATAGGNGAAVPAPPPSYKDLRFPPLRPIRLPRVETFTLPNGMTVMLVEDHELPLVGGSALVRTGELLDPADKVGLADITSDVLRTGGTTTQTGDQINQELEAIAASVETDMELDSARVDFSCLKENLPQVLGVFADVLMHPEFRADKIALDKVQAKGAIARRNDDAAQVASDQFHNLIYGPKTPYGWESEYATIDAIHRSDLLAFYHRYYVPNNILLAVHGDFSAPEMRRRVEAAFAAWPRGEAPPPSFPTVDSDFRPGVYTVNRPDVDQTNIRIGQLGGKLNAPDYPALSVMSEILGEGFASRLFLDVRTKLGLAYSVGGGWGGAYDHPGLFEISASTKSGSTVAAIQAIQTQVRGMQAAEVTPQELKTAKDEVLNSFVFAFDTPAKTLARLQIYRYWGYPADFIFTFRDRLRRVTAADVLRVAREYIKPNDFAYVVVGNEKDYGEPLSALHLPLSVLDTTIPTEPAPAEAAATPADEAAARAVLARAGAAMGGAAAAAIKDITTTASLTIQTPNGPVSATQASEAIPPDVFRQTVTLPMGSITTFYDGRGDGWVATPRGVVPLPAAVREQGAATLARDTREALLHFTEPDYHLHSLGRQVVNGVAADGVEITHSGQTFELWVDAASGRILSKRYRSAAGGPPAEITENYSGYRVVSGVPVAFAQSALRDGKPYLDVQITSVKFNSGLTAADLGKKPDSGAGAP